MNKECDYGRHWISRSGGTTILDLCRNEPMPLDSGEALGPITLAYETYGSLNEDKSNAILIEHALSGDAHAAA